MTINALGRLHVVSRPEAILTTHCREKLQMMQKSVKKWSKKRHFLDPFRGFLCDGFLEKVDIYFNSPAGSPGCSGKIQSNFDDSLQRKPLNGAKVIKNRPKVGIFCTHSAFFFSMAL